MGKKTKIKHDLAFAEQVLNEDHYGLDKVKDRILEYLAVQQRVDKVKAPILCLVGPPGVGKTSLGQSVARATGRKFVRMALGGVRDEAEIRGHRRTYIGSMPGKVLQSLSKVGTRNPLFLLDEIDKLGMDFRGDPSTALLEVLDPEQNHTFSDHYVEVDFDLSRRDVRRHLELDEHPAGAARPDGSDPPVGLHRGREAQHRAALPAAQAGEEQRRQGRGDGDHRGGGARHHPLLHARSRRALARARDLARSAARWSRAIQLKKYTDKVVVTEDNLNDFLGVRKFDYGQAEKKNQVGQVVGLAWTEVGGDLLTIEAAVMPGKGNIIRTG